MKQRWQFKTPQQVCDFIEEKLKENDAGEFDCLLSIETDGFSLVETPKIKYGKAEIQITASYDYDWKVIEGKSVIERTGKRFLSTTKMPEYISLTAKHIDRIHDALVPILTEPDIIYSMCENRYGSCTDFFANVDEAIFVPENEEYYAEDRDEVEEEKDED